ncbi:class D sortase [Caldalkalibacillus salinus]|uniref:class D sortase n=1 Tax=Caldalkalibacillus salinus TaxID=2803787 RepID=UPI001923A0D0|nr:class D sortase [Caldalkalibacillus salinus]
MMAVIFIFTGMICISIPTFSKFIVDAKQKELSKEWEALQSTYTSPQLNDEGRREAHHEFNRDDTASDDIQDHRKLVNENQVLGQLEIPKIDLDVMVKPGVEEAVLDHALGWMTSTSFPGEKGNVAIAGHRSHTYGQFFHRLGEIEEGDQITLNTHFATFTYEVDDILVVDPTDVSVIAPTDKETITLITCEPLYSNEYRLIVKGHKTNMTLKDEAKAEINPWYRL